MRFAGSRVTTWIFWEPTFCKVAQSRQAFCGVTDGAYSSLALPFWAWLVGAEEGSICRAPNYHLDLDILCIFLNESHTPQGHFINFAT